MFIKDPTKIACKRPIRTRKIIQLLKKEILAIVLCIKKFQDVFNKKFLFCLIVNMPKKFFKKMFKILFQNKFLQDGKVSCPFFILKLNSSKVIQTLFLIFSHMSFYKENDLSKAQSQFKNHKSLLCNAPSPTRKAQISKPGYVPCSWNFAFKPVQTNFCSKGLVKSKSTICG